MAALPIIEDSEAGSIVVVGSTAMAEIYGPTRSYAAVKAMLLPYVKGLARNLAAFPRVQLKLVMMAVETMMARQLELARSVTKTARTLRPLDAKFIIVPPSTAANSPLPTGRRLRAWCLSLYLVADHPDPVIREHRVRHHTLFRHVAGRAVLVGDRANLRPPARAGRVAR